MGARTDDGASIGLARGLGPIGIAIMLTLLVAGALIVVAVIAAALLVPDDPVADWERMGVPPARGAIEVARRCPALARNARAMVADGSATWARVDGLRAREAVVMEAPVRGQVCRGP